MSYKKTAALLIGLFFSATSIFANPTSDSHIVILPSCLNKLSTPFTTITTSDKFALIKTNEMGIQELIRAKNDRTKICGGFIDVTDAWQKLNVAKALSSAETQSFLLHYTKPVPQPHRDYKVQYPTEVKQTLNQINPTLMWSNLETLSSFPDRYARSENGVKAANWFKTQVETIAKNTGHDDVTVYYIATGSRYKQPSVVVKIGHSNEAGVVIGAHLDTLEGVSPGADDDGSGSVTILEAARTLLTSGLQFKKPIYFIWYAAEEEGMIGSQYVVKEFQNKNIPIAAVMHFDMTGFAYKNDPSIWLMKDYVNKDLTAFLQTLIETYVKQPVKYTACGYACSDHATWYQAGFATSLPAEAAFEKTNPAMHSSRDTMDKLSLNHMTDYVKIATAFAIELAEPNTNK